MCISKMFLQKANLKKNFKKMPANHKGLLTVCSVYCLLCVLCKKNTYCPCFYFQKYSFLHVKQIVSLVCLNFESSLRMQSSLRIYLNIYIYICGYAYVCDSVLICILCFLLYIFFYNYRILYINMFQRFPEFYIYSISMYRYFL